MKNPWEDDVKNSESETQNKKINTSFKLNSNLNFNDVNIDINCLAKILGLFLVCYVALSGFYIIKPEETGIITRLGKYHRTIQSGLHYKMPFPIEKLHKEQTKRVRNIVIGIDEHNSVNEIIKHKRRLETRVMSGAILPQVKEEDRMDIGLMLTGDENIASVQFEIQWRIADLSKFIFNVKYPDITVYNVGRSVFREIIGTNQLTEILTTGRGKIEKQSKELLQQILDEYGAGIDIILVQILKSDPPAKVVDSFRDVQTARVDKESAINKAMTYANEIIPKAKGDARRRIIEAEAYSVKVINDAKGEARKFDAIYSQYKNNPFVVRKKMYLDGMRQVFSNSDLVVIDKNIKTVVMDSKNNNTKKIVNETLSNHNEIHQSSEQQN